ncbi:MAG: Crp/Fnr family transcriptional regulator [Flavobacteriaceae bacterium]|nr:Crp/Fnr family transcriptional regulator [Flavobacteriaceae bacterium]
MAIPSKNKASEIILEEALQDNYGVFFEAALLKEILKVGKYKSLSSDEVILDVGQEIQYFPLLLSGAIRVMRYDEDGDELLLYYLETGDTCALSLSCCLDTKKSEIKAITEQTTSLLLIPVEYAEIWLDAYPGWRRFVLDSYHYRMNELLETVDSLAFMKMEERVYKYLKDKAMVNHSPQLNITHQSIAYDMHTARVVVSRVLKNLEKRGKISATRNQIHLLQW